MCYATASELHNVIFGKIFVYFSLSKTREKFTRTDIVDYHSTPKTLFLSFFFLTTTFPSNTLLLYFYFLLLLLPSTFPFSFFLISILILYLLTYFVKKRPPITYFLKHNHYNHKEKRDSIHEFLWL